MSRHRWSAPVRTSRLLLRSGIACTALLLLQLGLGQPLGLGAVPARAATASAHPNRFDPRSGTTSILHRPQASTAANAPAPGPYAPPRQISVPMQPGRVAVDPGSGAHFVGSD